MDRFSTLGFPMMKNILSRFDLPEVTRFKAISLHFRNLISSPQFARAYNLRESSIPWTAIHVFRDEDSLFGEVRFVRDSDGKQIVFQLEALLHGQVAPASRISLICASGSLILFRVASLLGHLEFVVVNMFSRQHFVVEVPPAFTVTCRHNVELMRDPDTDFGFIIRYGQIDGDTPVIREYWSENEQWGIDLTGILIDDDELLDTQDPRKMILTNAEGSVAFLAFPFGFQLPEFKMSTPFELFDVNPMNFAVNHPAGRLRVAMSLHFSRGGSGYAMVLVRFFDGNAFAIRNLYLFRLNDSWTQYQLVSTFPHDDLPQCVYQCGSLFIVEVTDEVVKFAIPTNPTFPISFKPFMLFTYNITDGSWLLQNKFVFQASIPVVPCFSSKLTIRS